MQVIASLRKRTKDGSVSTWTFCVDNEMKMSYAVGGRDLKVIPATDRKHLRQIYQSFLKYGYTRKLPTMKKQQFIDDPWSSELSPALQMELEALSA